MHRRHQDMLARFNAVCRRSFTADDRATDIDQRIDHRVAHVLDRLGRPAFRQ